MDFNLLVFFAILALALVYFGFDQRSKALVISAGAIFIFLGIMLLSTSITDIQCVSSNSSNISYVNNCIEYALSDAIVDTAQHTLLGLVLALVGVALFLAGGFA